MAEASHRILVTLSRQKEPCQTRCPQLRGIYSEASRVDR